MDIDFAIIGTWLICAIASERATEAITTSVFFAPLRQFLGRAAMADQMADKQYEGTFTNKIFIKAAKWSSDLVSCGWCTSFWTSLFFSLFLPGGYFSLVAANNIVVKSIALWGFANLWHSIFRLIHNGRVAAIDVNLKIIDNDTDVDNNGGSDGEFGEGVGEESTIGIEPPTV
jgi:hypothetical protein